MGRRTASPFLALLLAMGLASGAAAQGVREGEGTRLVDRIVAVVGSKPILASQVEEQLAQLQAQSAAVPTDSAGRSAFRRQILTQMIEEELLVQQAERDTTVRVTDQEVQDAVEQTVQNVRRQFASEIEFQSQLKAAGFASTEEWRRWLADSQRRSILQQRLIESLRQKGKLKPIPPTDADMRAFWEANRGQQPKRPAAVSFRQLVVVPRADSAARARAWQTAESLVVELRRGADFAAAARRFSDDSSSREVGGELGWFRRGVMVKGFENAAFRLRPGEISDVVETEFGFHIIKVDRAQPAEVLARHVLIAPDIAPAQIEIAHRLADSLRALLASGGGGGASFDSLARRHADPNEPKLGEDVPISQLPPEYQQRIAGDTVSGRKPVFVVGEGGRRPKFVILELTGHQPEGDLTFEDVKGRIRERLSQELAVRHYLNQLRRQIYIDIRL